MSDLSKYEITKEERDALESVFNKLHKLAADRGWHDKPREDGTMIALMHSELSEAMEGNRKDKDDEHLSGFKNEPVELADCIIRIADYAKSRGLPIVEALAQKHMYNATREDHSREARAKAGGKKY